MLKSVPLDILYICAELLTGKSLPVLVGFVRLPIGQGLAWLSVTAGALTGTCFSVWAARQSQSLSLLSFADRLLQLSFSLFLSVSHLLALAKGVHPDHGPTLVLIPAFCLVWHPLPQRHSTALVAFLLSWATFYVSGLMTSIDAGIPTTAATLEEAMSHSRLRHHQTTHAPSPYAVVTLQQIVVRALQLFALGAYATIQHAPTQVFFDTHHPMTRPVYASHHHAKHAPYSLFMGLVAAWLRVCAWTVVCFSHENFLTLMLDPGTSSPGAVLRWDWLCCIFYSVTLLYLPPGPPRSCASRSSRASSHPTPPTSSGSSSSSSPSPPCIASARPTSCSPPPTSSPPRPCSPPSPPSSRRKKKTRNTPHQPIAPASAQTRHSPGRLAASSNTDP